MSTYNVPRNTKGEGRILFIFSTKALIYTGIGIGIGWVFYFIFNLMKLSFVGIIMMVLFGIIGFSIATFNMPNISKIDVARKNSGQSIDEIIRRYLKFKMKKVKIYALYKGGNSNGK